MPDPVTLADLLAAVQRFAADHFPGTPPASVTIAFRDGSPAARFPVPPCPPPAPSPSRPHPFRGEEVVPPPSAGPQTDRQRDILAALAEFPAGDRPVGKVVAGRAGYPFDADFRRDLAALADCGLLTSHAPGYSLPGR